MPKTTCSRPVLHPRTAASSDASCRSESMASRQARYALHLQSRSPERLAARFQSRFSSRLFPTAAGRSVRASPRDRSSAPVAIDVWSEGTDKSCRLISRLVSLGALRSHPSFQHTTISTPVGQSCDCSKVHGDSEATHALPLLGGQSFDSFINFHPDSV
jgi:hypothetical protein